MSESHRITFRVPDALLKAAEKQRGESDMGAYIRSLIAKDCGIDPAKVEELPRGLAGAKKGVAKKAARKRWKDKA